GDRVMAVPKPRDGQTIQHTGTRRAAPFADGSAAHLEVQGLEPPLLVDPRGEAHGEGGAVIVVLDVFFPAPDELDRSSDRAGDFRRLDREIRLPAPPEATTEIGAMDGDLLRVHLKDFGEIIAQAAGSLGRRPDLATIVPHMDRA